MDLKHRAFKLYKQGLTLREVGAALGRSHEWVNKAVKELTAIDTALGYDKMDLAGNNTKVAAENNKPNKKL